MISMVFHNKVSGVRESRECIFIKTSIVIKFKYQKLMTERDS